MQENQLYEYAVIRVVPKVEREEFLNVGIILYCKKQGFLQAKYILDKQRLSVFGAELDFEDLEKYLQTWEKICIGGKDGGYNRHVTNCFTFSLAYCHSKYDCSDFKNSSRLFYRCLTNA